MFVPIECQVLWFGIELSIGMVSSFWGLEIM